MPDAAPDPLEVTRSFLQEYFAEAEGPEETANLIECQVLMNAGPVARCLRCIEELLSRPQPPGTLRGLVERDARIALPAPSEEGARDWLARLADHLRRELDENLLPFQPMRARLARRSPPDDEALPHDLFLYATDEPRPEHWKPVWTEDLFYAAFLREWDGRTCPACRTPTVQKTSVETFAVYRCTECRLGWTERRRS